MPLIFYILSIIIGSLITLSCRSHKESSVKESSFVEQSSTAHANVQLSEVSESHINSSISFDSIEIFIEKNWKDPIPLSSQFRKFFNDMATAPTDSSKQYNYPDSFNPDLAFSSAGSIHIKAYGVNASKSSQSTDSLSGTSSFEASSDSTQEMDMEAIGSENSTAVYDPPNALAVVGWAFIIGAFIMIIVYLFKRKSI